MNPPKPTSHPQLIGGPLALLTSIAFAISASVVSPVARAAESPQCPAGQVLNVQTNACVPVKPPTAPAPAPVIKATAPLPVHLPPPPPPATGTSGTSGSTSGVHIVAIGPGAAGALVNGAVNSATPQGVQAQASISFCGVSPPGGQAVTLQYNISDPNAPSLPLAKVTGPSTVTYHSPPGMVGGCTNNNASTGNLIITFTVFQCTAQTNCIGTLTAGVGSQPPQYFYFVVKPPAS
jgi:hypothetical protein